MRSRTLTEAALHARRQVIENPSDGLEDFDLVPLVAKKRKVKAVLNNSFGFGGTNASLIMRAVED